MFVSAQFVGIYPHNPGKDTIFKENKQLFREKFLPFAKLATNPVFYCDFFVYL